MKKKETRKELDADFDISSEELKALIAAKSIPHRTDEERIMPPSIDEETELPQNETVKELTVNNDANFAADKKLSNKGDVKEDEVMAILNPGGVGALFRFQFLDKDDTILLDLTLNMKELTNPDAFNTEVVSLTEIRFGGRMAKTLLKDLIDTSNDLKCYLWVSNFHLTVKSLSSETTARLVYRMRRENNTAMNENVLVYSYRDQRQRQLIYRN